VEYSDMGPLPAWLQTDKKEHRISVIMRGDGKRIIGGDKICVMGSAQRIRCRSYGK
jgi:hypothetical protein